MSLVRQYLFELWEENVGEDEKKNTVKRHVIEYLLSQGISDEDTHESVLKKLDSFLVSLRSRWIQSKYSRRNFLVKNSEWLKENFFDVESLAGCSSTSERSTRPFAELGEKQKKRRVQYLLDNYTYEELAYAARLSLYAAGKRDSSAIVKEITEISSDAATTMKKLYNNPVVMPKRYSPEEALALFIKCRHTKYTYTCMQVGAKNHSAPIYPSYPLILEAKKECYPSDESIRITETVAEVTLQGLLDHTSQRLALVLEELLKNNTSDISELTLYCKWGCDGSSGHSYYKQRFLEDPDIPENPEVNNENEEVSVRPVDSDIYSICMVPVQIRKNDDNTIIWQNKKSSSPRFCRPIKIAFEKETKEQIKKEIHGIDAQIMTLNPSIVYLEEGNSPRTIKYDLQMTMVDGKTVGAYTGHAVQNCNICGATPSLMNDLPSIYSRPRDTSQFLFGVSSLHAYIRCLEMFLNISYRLELRKWKVYKKEVKDFEILKKTKTHVQRGLWERLGLLVDVVKQGVGSCNDGNTAARFFEEYSSSAQVTGLNEELLKRFYIVLQAISSGYNINTERFSAYTRDTAELYVSEYPWYPMPASVHKLLVHAHEVIDSCSIAIGLMSEEAIEARNKDLRRFRKENTRKNSRRNTMEDLFHTLFYSSDPYISSINLDDTDNDQSNFTSYPEELLDLLSDRIE